MIVTVIVIRSRRCENKTKKRRVNTHPDINSLDLAVATSRAT